MRYIHLGNEPKLIAGAATYALEIFTELSDVDAILVPIGGGTGACGCAIVRSGLGRATKLKHLWLAPFTLHKQVLRAIQNETRHARDGKKGRIIAKMNALLEPEVIAALHDASQAGVEIDLLVRGVCALKPGVQ